MNFPNRRFGALDDNDEDCDDTVVGCETVDGEGKGLGQREHEKWANV